MTVPAPPVPLLVPGTIAVLRTLAADPGPAGRPSVPGYQDRTSFNSSI